MKYNMYVFDIGQKEDVEIIEKKWGQTNEKHFIYILKGITARGTYATSNVNKEVWDRYDVPIVKMEVKKHARNEYEISRKNYKRKMKIPPKSQRKVENEEIEKWLAEHLDLDWEKISSQKYGEGY